MMHNIIIIDNSIYVTGALKSIIGFAERIKDKYTFLFAMDINSEAASFVLKKGYTIYNIQYIEISKKFNFILYSYKLFYNTYKIISLSKKNNAKIIHVNDIYNMIGVLCKILNYRIKIVYHSRLSSLNYLGFLYFIYVFFVKIFSNSIIFVSKNAGKIFFGHSKSILIYDFINININDSLEKKVCLNIIKFCNFLYIGNYISGKGQDLALKAFSQIYHLLPDSSVTFVGSGENGEFDFKFVKKLKKICSDLHIENMVYFLGQSENIERLMKDFDVVINFSESESFSMVCLEALTYGMPLIATDCGGPSEIITNNINGILIENRNIDQAAQAMYRIATEPGLAARFSKAGPISVAEKFSAEKSVDRLVAIYNSLIADNKA